MNNDPTPQADAAKLKPCPFCGKSPETIGVESLQIITSVRCRPCSVAWRSPKDWNTRPAPPSPEQPGDGERLLDWWEAHPNIEIGRSWDPECDDIIVWTVNGGVNDREWTEIGRGETLRAAIRSAMGKEGGE